jgi:TonB family protein
MRSVVLGVVSVVWLAGCAVTTSIVREEAAEDLDCPEDQLSVADKGGIFHVTGCELRARYECSRDGLTPSLCVRVALSGVPVAEREGRVREKAAAQLECDPDALAIERQRRPGRYLAKGCDKRIEYECYSRADCCAFSMPGVEPLDQVRTYPAESKGNAKGSLSKQVIGKVAAASDSEISLCFAAALKSNAGLGGLIDVQFIIAPDGTVQTAAVRRSSFAQREMEKCVIDATRRLQFPKPEDGGIVVVTYPYVFLPNAIEQQACR